MIKKKKVSNDFEKSSSTYFTEISSFKPLSLDKELSLWEQYKKNNDISARDELIKSNLKFVASIAKQYQGLGLSYSDLIAEGNIGLLKAFEKFDYERGFKTISYSVWWIKQNILEALGSRNLLKGEELPMDFESQNDSDDDVLQLVGDGEANDEYIENGTASEIVNTEEKKITSMLMSCLDERETFIIKNYFGFDELDELTLEEIGAKLGLTKERVRQIKEKALKKLRCEALKNSISFDYL